MAAARPLPYARLSGFYFFYFAALGAFLPYWALYLQATGYSPVQIGQLMALLAATKLVSPNLWGWLADHTDRSVRLIRLSSCLTATAFALVFWFSGFGWMGLIMLLTGFFWNAPLPLFEAVTLAYLNWDAKRYSHVRLWGSIGFIAAVLSVGQALDSVFVIECLPVLIVVLFTAMGLVTLAVPEKSVRGHGGVEGSLTRILRQPQVILFFGVFLLVQLAHGPYYTFFSVYLRDYDYDGGSIGLLWAVGVLAEIVLFMFLHRLLQRFSLRRVVLIATGLGVLRWLLIAWFVNSPAVLFGAQLLHAATFGASHVAAINLVHQYFAGPHHGKGQALYSSISYGVGGMLGSYLSGIAWEPLGPQLTFSIAGGCSLLAWLIVWLWVDRAGGNPAQPGSLSRSSA